MHHLLCYLRGLSSGFVPPPSHFSPGLFCQRKNKKVIRGGLLRTNMCLQCFVRTCTYDLSYEHVHTMLRTDMYLRFIVRTCTYNASYEHVHTMLCTDMYLQCFVRTCTYDLSYGLVLTLSYLYSLLPCKSSGVSFVELIKG